MANVIKDKNGIWYQQVSGVVLGNQFFPEQEFIQYIQNLLKTRKAEDYDGLKIRVQKAQDILKGIEKNKRTIATKKNFLSKVKEISKEFNRLLNEEEKAIQLLGGDISLFTTFNLTGEDISAQSSYYLLDEQSLPSYTSEVKGIVNIIQNYKTVVSQIISNIEEEEKKGFLMDDTINLHLMNFYNQLISQETQDIQQYQQLKIWSYYNMRNRYDAIKKASNQRWPKQPSIARYFWGQGQIVGYVNEAFTTHLVLFHPDTLLGKAMMSKQTVIDEHGGAGSYELFSLLNATKGQIAAQYGGDVIVLNKDNTIAFNIQSKASVSNYYGYQKKYTKYLQDIETILTSFIKLSSSDWSQEDAETIVQKIKADAWQPLVKQAGLMVYDASFKKLEEVSKNLTKSK